MYNSKNPKNKIISDSEVVDLRTALNIVAQNEIYGHFDLTSKQRDYLAKTNIRMFARIFPNEHSYIKGEPEYEDIDNWDIDKYLSGRDEEDPPADALTQMLDIIEQGSPYKLVECLKDVILQNNPEASSKSSESIELNSSDVKEHDEFNKTYKRSKKRRSNRKLSKTRRTT